jgi:hypothetical protein
VCVTVCVENGRLHEESSKFQPTRGVVGVLSGLMKS